MKKNFRLFIFFIVALCFPFICQASITILTSTAPDHTITSGSDEQVYGTSASNQITLESGAIAELINFPGQNTILIQAGSDLFTVSRSGTVVTFEGTDGTLLKIPATISVQTVDFSDQCPLTLSIHNGQVMLDDQVITTTPESIENDLGKPVIGCGAFVAPGVWKEFDCYNLAAIGKTTNDDPFTPSWRLIGGYWQWGRKGPDPSQWYDTNTEHFAHGPTGEGPSETNEDSISSWDGDAAPDDAWSGCIKTPSDPCPAGYRVPTRSQWDGVRNNNTQSTEGTWNSSPTNYSSARFFGNGLMLLAAGLRRYDSGTLYNRGYNGRYWSSSEGDSSNAWYLTFYSSFAGTGYFKRLQGISVRCISE